ncbi:hypothetical protein EDD86DRAFT_192928 [Gorgonomyces haynaldii]|nr:hypothetical protein EDD86DRAFT_192928 [Gorgonomyces haynaldii]
MISNACVFCGSTFGKDPKIKEDALELADKLSQNSIGLVYGGGDIGLMGLIARRMADNGSQVKGILPRPFVGPIQQDFGELILVDDMHTRKQLFLKHSDCFIALPGGWGTMEEVCEATTWYQLNIHKKRVVCLNTNGYFNGLRSWLDHAKDEGFIKHDILVFCDTVDQVIETIQTPLEVDNYGLTWKPFQI